MEQTTTAFHQSRRTFSTTGSKAEQGVSGITVLIIEWTN